MRSPRQETDGHAKSLLRTVCGMHTHRQAWFATLTAVALMVPFGGPVDAGRGAVVEERRPAVSISGGSAQHRRTVLDAVDRFASSGLDLPDLHVRIHVDNSGCMGKQGLFRRSGDVGVIDLCFTGEFLALHELGHAWERFNLADDDRVEFMRSTGASTWRSTDVIWRNRGAEQAANVIANGLLSAPLETTEYHTEWFAQFEALAGVVTPRLEEVQPSDQSVLAPSVDQARRLAAYEAWRATAG